MSTYTIHSVSCVRDCRFCGPVPLTVAGPIETTAEHLSDDIALACDDEAARNHWIRDVYEKPVCPRCSWERRELLADEARSELPIGEEAA